MSKRDYWIKQISVDANGAVPVLVRINAIAIDAQAKFGFDVESAYVIARTVILTELALDGAEEELVALFKEVLDKQYAAALKPENERNA